MKAFAKPSGIARLSLEARLVYSVFCGFMLLGYASSLWFYLDDDFGAGTDGVVRYYLGNDSPTSDHRPPSGSDSGPKLALSGLELDLPSVDDGGVSSVELAQPEVGDQNAGHSLRFAKPPRQMVETFHFHIFSVPVALLIVAHVFMMCDVSRANKVWTILLASVGTLIHLVLPLLVRFGSPGFAVGFFPSAALMMVTWGYMTFWPLVEMWRPAWRRAGS